MSDDLDFSAATAARWTWQAEEIRRVGHRVVDLIAEHLTQIPDEPVFRPFPNDRATAMLNESLPEHGSEGDTILQRFAEDVMPYPFGNGHPRFAGWVNGPPVVLSVFAEALAAAMNPSVAGGNHAATYVERQVLEWFKQLIGFPPQSMGLLVSGGSAATLTALACARHAATGGAVRADGLRPEHGQLVVYISQEGHSAIRKAVELLGLGRTALRTIGCDAAYRIDVAGLEQMLVEDLADGLRPMAVAVTAGTVSTGAIDPLREVRALCDRHQVWMHVDGAYGAPAILDPRYTDELAPMAHADSVAIDPHKWLYVPYDAGAVLVRDAELMRDTFTLVPPYLQEDSDPGGVTWLRWFSEYGPEQTRPFRALKIWMALQYHGRAGYAESISRDNRLADHLAELVDNHPDLDLVAHNLSIVCLRAVPAGLPAAELNEFNRRLLRTVQLSGQAFLSGTEIGARFVLRACLINHRTTGVDVDHIFNTITSEARRQRDQWTHSATDPDCAAKDTSG